MNHLHDDLNIYSLLVPAADVVSESATSNDSETLNVTVTDMQKTLNAFVNDMTTNVFRMLMGRNDQANRLFRIRAIYEEMMDGDASLAMPFIKYCPNKLDISAAVSLLRSHPNIVLNDEQQNWVESSRNLDDIVIVRDNYANEGRKVINVPVRNIDL